MSLVIKTNVATLQADQFLSGSRASLQAKGTGFRTSTGADAGLALTGLKAQLQSLNLSERNANEGVSLAQEADRGMREQGAVLARLRELAQQASNESLSDSDRGFLDTERKQLTDELDRIAGGTHYNGVHPLDDAADGQTVTLQPGTEKDGALTLTLASTSARALGLDTMSLETADGAQAAIDALDKADATLQQGGARMNAFMNRANVLVTDVQSRALDAVASGARAKDVNVAEEQATMAKNQVLTQQGASVLAQAGQLAQLAFGLLGG